MKKYIAMILAAVLALSLVACGGNSASSQPAESKAESEAESQEGAGMVNPLREMTQEEMVQETGIDLQLPAEAENVKFFVLTVDDTKTSQANFTYNGKEYTYRVASTSEFEAADKSGLNYEWANTETTHVDYCEATVSTCDQAGVIYWIDVVPGINYTLGCNAAVTAEELIEVANQCFVPMQGDADGDVEAVDYTGSYTTEEGSTAEVVSTEEGYDVSFGLFRLAQLDGTGTNMDGAMEVELKDPNEGEMYGVFYPAEDGTFTLNITQSQWDLLEAGTEFTGFTLN